MAWVFLALLVGATALASCGQPLPPPESTAHGLPVAAAPGRPEGRLLYVRGGNVRVWSNGQETQLTQEGNYSQPRWSPTGNAMLYVRRGDSFMDLYVADSAGKNARAITANQSKAYVPETKEYVDASYLLTGPSWGKAPEGGDRIIFSSDRENVAFALWVMNGLSANPQPIFATRELGAHAEGAALSPDGKFVAFTLDVTNAENVRTTQLHIVDLNIGVYSAIGQNQYGAYDPAWSPNGQWIAYALRVGDQTQLWVIRPDGTGAQRIVADGRNRGPAWSPDGNQLVFARQQGAGFGLAFVDLEATQTGFNASKPQSLGEFADVDPASGISWTR